MTIKIKGMHNFRNLQIWQDSIDLATEIYKITSAFPKDEKYNLISQLRRSATSISSNIAEGAGRNTSKEFNYFLGISTGSSYELETQLVIAERLELLDKNDFEKIIESLHSIQKRTYKLKQSIMR